MADPELMALAERLQGICLGRGLTVAVAESCTGGLVASTLTEVAGASGYFRGGIVSYSDGSKTRLLAVEPATITAHGSVSAQAARAMAIGARVQFAASLAASVTGIAGPDGGTPEKPVGMTYVGLATRPSTSVRRFAWQGDRAANRHQSTRAVIEWLIEAAEEMAAEVPR